MWTPDIMKCNKSAMKTWETVQLQLQVSQALSGLEPLIRQLYVRAGRRPEGLTPRPHTDIYL